MNAYRILTGDAIEQLRNLPDGCVHCVVTSPPYLGLRDYGVDGQIGLEQTPAEYVDRLVAVFREVRRVLRDDGTVWLNLGDSYASIGRTGRKESPGVGAKQEIRRVERDVIWHAGDGSKFQWTLPGGIKPKDLVGIPWRVAFALQDDGWWLRSDIIWAKPNPMPESVTDRPTKAHEYIFLLTKAARYFFDADAVREKSVDPEGSAKRYEAPFFVGKKHESGGYSANGAKHTAGMKLFDAGRNIRTVWDIATQPYSGAHFATMPTEIPRRCIKAGTSERGCCPACGAPWRRVVEKGNVIEHPSRLNRANDAAQFNVDANEYGPGGSLGRMRQSTTTGWQPTCDCDAGDPIPCTVLDPFLGSGTTALAAMKEGRQYAGYDVSEAYCQMARERIAANSPSHGK